MKFLLRRLPVLVVATAVMASATSALAFHTPSSPFNDNFANAQFIGGASGSVFGSTVGATNQFGEPSTRSVGVWYAWTAPTNGTVSFTTCNGASYDTWLEAFSGSTLGGLSLLASNDDACGLRSYISFVTTGQTYRIRVGGFASQTGSFTLSWSFVSSNTAPVLTVPASITAEATSAAGAVVTFAATATDAQSGTLTPTCTPASGSTFALGQTTVSCSVTDPGGLSDSESFSVTVADTTAPELTLPGDITAEAASGAGAVVSYEASASDVVDSSPAVICSPASGETFALGTTTVSCTATDEAGNSSSPGSFTVTVADTTAPAATCVNGPDPSGKNEPNGNAGFRTIMATDAVGVVTLQIVDSASSFVSSNLASGSNVKLTRASGNASERTMAGAVVKHISTTGAAMLRAVDAAGNVTQVDC